MVIFYRNKRFMVVNNHHYWLVCEIFFNQGRHSGGKGVEFVFVRVQGGFFAEFFQQIFGNSAHARGEVAVGILQGEAVAAFVVAVGKQGFQAACLQVGPGEVKRYFGDADAVQCGAGDGFGVAQGKGAPGGGVGVQCAVCAAEVPGHEFAAEEVAHDDAVCVEVFAAARGAVLRKVGGAGGEADAQGGDVARDHGGFGDIAAAHDEVVAGLHEVDDAVFEVDFKADGGVAVQQAGELRQDEAASDGAGYGQAHDARRALPRGVNVVGGVLQQVDGGFGVGEEVAPFVGEAEAAGGALEEAHAQCFFEYADVFADGGRCDAEYVRGGGEAAVAGGVDEGVEVFEFVGKRHIFNGWLLVLFRL